LHKKPRHALCKIKSQSKVVAVTDVLPSGELFLMPEELNDGRVYVRLSDRTFKCVGVDNLVKSEDAMK